MKLHHFRVVDAIIAHRTLLRASVALGLSQPALTRIVRELEQTLGQALFLRLPRGMRPTETGLAFNRSGQVVLAELRRLETALERQGGTVAVGTLPVAASGVLPGVLSRLKTLHCGVEIQVRQGRTEELLPLLASGEIDLIVGRLYEPVVADGLVREALWEEPIAVLAAAGHPIFAAPITIDGLRQCELVLPTVGQRVGHEIEAFLRDQGLMPAVALRSSSYGFMREMLHESGLISAMPSLMMAGDLLRGTLRIVPLPGLSAVRPAGLILAGDRRLTEAGEAFVSCLRAHVAELARLGLAVISKADGSAPKNDRTRRRERG